MIADKIKFLREEKGITQTQLAKRLGITRSSVNAWEMGVSTPSTLYIIEFNVNNLVVVWQNIECRRPE